MIKGGNGEGDGDDFGTEGDGFGERRRTPTRDNNISLSINITKTLSEPRKCLYVTKLCKYFLKFFIFRTESDDEFKILERRHLIEEGLMDCP